MNRPLILVPAYGRKYQTMEEVKKDWHEGKDFRLDGGGPYCSIRDFVNNQTVQIRYKPGIYVEIKM